MPIELTEHLVQQYAKLAPSPRKKVDKSIHLLDSDFRHPGLKNHPVQSALGIFEASVESHYRLTYERRGDVLLLRNVDKHDDRLRNP
jgi:hypothetical protein